MTPAIRPSDSADPSNRFLSVFRWRSNKSARKRAHEDHAWVEQKIGEKWGGVNEKGNLVPRTFTLTWGWGKGPGNEVVRRGRS